MLEGELILQVLENIKPDNKVNLIDLVRDAGLDVSDWSNYGDGSKPASTNPRYCYEWSFVQPGKVALCLWFNNFVEIDGIISNPIDFSAKEKGYTGARLGRFRKLHEAIKVAFREKLQVRVVIGLTEDGTYKTVDQRVLDLEPWAVTFYDGNQCTLVRGAKPIKFIDQFSLLVAGTDEPKRRDYNGTVVCRSADVRRQVLERAQGYCEYCGSLGFQMANGEIYLETHHIISLSEGGPDRVPNVAGLCPNHHREAHHGQNRRTIFERLQIKVSGGSDL